ncbi:MAG: TonB family protein [Gammaproteobacteria bacterium]|nr:TonB family protein [Gammaproteobacteria bacterium]
MVSQTGEATSSTKSHSSISENSEKPQKSEPLKNERVQSTDERLPKQSRIAVPKKGSAVINNVVEVAKQDTIISDKKPESEKSQPKPEIPPLVKMTATTDEQLKQISANRSQHQQLSHLLELALARHFNYPLLARRKGLQGKVILAFTLGRSGNIMNVRIARSSGHGILDRAAIASLNKISPLNQTPSSDISFELPVIYQIVHS